MSLVARARARRSSRTTPPLSLSATAPVPSSASADPPTGEARLPLFWHCCFWLVPVFDDGCGHQTQKSGEAALVGVAATGPSRSAPTAAPERVERQPWANGYRADWGHLRRRVVVAPTGSARPAPNGLPSAFRGLGGRSADRGNLVPGRCSERTHVDVVEVAPVEPAVVCLALDCLDDVGREVGLLELLGAAQAAGAE